MTIDNSPAARAARLRAMGRTEQADAIVRPPAPKTAPRRRLSGPALVREARARFWRGQDEREIAAALGAYPHEVRGALFATIQGEA